MCVCGIISRQFELLVRKIILHAGGHNISPQLVVLRVKYLYMINLNIKTNPSFSRFFFPFSRAFCMGTRTNDVPKGHTACAHQYTVKTRAYATRVSPLAPTPPSSKAFSFFLAPPGQ